MVKYRYLTDEELREFEEEFKHFLIANGLHSEEWEELNKTNPAKALEVVGLFSNLILDKVYDKIRFIVHIGQKDLKAFKFYDDKAVLIGVDYKGNYDFPQENILKFITENASEMLIYSTIKSFSKKEKNDEVHFLVKLGGDMSDGSIFNFLSKIKEKQ
jgi:hypothetical protein